MIDIPCTQIVKYFYIYGILYMLDGLLCCSGSNDSVDTYILFLLLYKLLTTDSIILYNNFLAFY
jgi:hypothetical protein